jgi:hypothetical protein|tara:strand:- start:101 stop:355 length:255 start_codon:yes stop_codon:yes gene_type:complete
MTREDVAEYNEEALICDGFDEAIIGVAERINLGPVAAYSVEKIIEILMERDEMTYEDAYEYFSYNVIGAWMGEYTPVFIYTNQE